VTVGAALISPSNSSESKQLNATMLGYGALHAELMREIKEKLKERYVE